ncbi:site-specific DNA-methyltransferase [Aeromonas caviae]|uniref:site-specific DNA-methyltransferase n=1 Tax=Aeromonas caviae TaxID=648 RepID=UPI0022814771|nr:site-specific DNA-methyltransferase [Aeromonas caviae]MCY9811868.1 site-specific DNA-methyltransferase [Aeromonas caviae]
MPTLNWIGKEAVIKHHKAVPFRLVEPVVEHSCGDNHGADSGNLIVQGDNLLALKALLPRYAGQVKCIYIDPPYNTGNEGWVYNDNVNSPEIRKWLGETVGKEGETLDRHDRWLCMMYPRLVLLKQFLREDGVIFISIDDAANSLLKMICDEIFGVKNFLATLIWNTEGNTDNQFEIKVNHEYVIAYLRDANQKSKAIGNVVDPNTREDSNLWKGIADNNINKNNPANPPAIFEIPAGFPSKEESLHYSAKSLDDHFFEITKAEGLISDAVKESYGIEKLSGLPVKIDDLVVENNKVVRPCRVYGGFANRKKLEQFVANGFKPVEDDGGPIEFYINANAAIRYRKIVASPSNILSVLRGFGTTERMKGELKRMEVHFNYPKPVELISYLLKIGAEGKDSLILDSFAGSGTTGHAVLKQNAEDGGNRRFILVEMDKGIAKNVTAERVKRVSRGYTNAKGKDVEGLGGGFQYCRLSDKPLFKADGPIRADVTFSQLAEFVWFMETGTGLAQSALPKRNQHTPFLGTYKDRAVFLLYNGILKDKSDIGGNVVNNRTLEILTESLPNFKGERVVYGARSRFDKKKLAALGITFHQLPYELAVKTWF